MSDQRKCLERSFQDSRTPSAVMDDGPAVEAVVQQPVEEQLEQRIGMYLDLGYSIQRCPTLPQICCPQLHVSSTGRMLAWQLLFFELSALASV